MKEMNFEQMDGITGGELNVPAAFTCGIGVVFVAASFYAGLGFLTLQLIGEGVALACVASIN